MIDIAPTASQYIAVTGVSRVHVYDPSTNDCFKTLTKFKAGTMCARFRPSDAKLVAVGSEDGAVSLIEVATKTALRTFRGHENAVREARFSGGGDGKAVVSFSDDRTVRRWDVATEKELAKLDEHRDYVRAGCVSSLSSDVFVSGSYDHMVKVWDARSGGPAFISLDHGSPVEDVALLPNDALLVSVGGHDVKVWDLLSGGRLLSRLSPHNKTITCLSSASNRTRLVTGSLDGHVKFHDVSTFKTVHSIKFPSPILTFGVAQNDSFVAAGMSDGLVQFLHRKDPEEKREKEREEFLAKPANKFLQYTTFQPRSGDVIVKQEEKTKETKHDYWLRKFEHSKALDSVLRPYVVRTHPEYTYAVLVELKR